MTSSRALHRTPAPPPPSRDFRILTSAKLLADSLGPIVKIRSATRAAFFILARSIGGVTGAPGGRSAGAGSRPSGLAAQSPSAKGARSFSAGHLALERRSAVAWAGAWLTGRAVSQTWFCPPGGRRNLGLLRRRRLSQLPAQRCHQRGQVPHTAGVSVVTGRILAPARRPALRGRRPAARADQVQSRPGTARARPGRDSRDVRRRRAGSRDLPVVALYPARHQQPDPQATARNRRRRLRRRHPGRQRATDASLRARLTAALDRNRQLADENARLRRQLAHALGDQRSSRTRTGNDPER